jgi:hypothetical protein
MRTCTTDPISGKDVANLNSAPFVIEGRGESALKVYFESEANKAEYEGVELEHAGQDLAADLDNPRSMGGEARK